MKGAERPLRIVLDTAALRRPATGTARWINGLGGELARRPGIELLEAGGSRLITRGGRLHRVPNFVSERWWYEVGIGRFARRARADALLLPANLAARRGRVPQVVTVLDVNFLALPGTYERSFVRYASWAFRRSILEADRATTISAFSRRTVSEHLGTDPALLDVVYPGLDEPMAIETGARPIDPPYALYVGATEVHKNVGLLLEAWSAGPPRGLRLAIVGQPGRDHARLSEQAARLGDHVLLVGRVSHEELERWYRHAAVFVFPSRMEGFGYPPLEAMQRGVPVVASASGSLPEVLGEAALYHDPDDAAAVRRLVEWLVDDADERHRRVENGIRQATRYRWAGTAERMHRLLASVSGR